MKKILIASLCLLALNACQKEEDPTPTPTTIEINENIESETIWEDLNKDPDAIDYLVKKSTLSLKAGLIIRPGVVIAFEAGTRLNVENGGFLQAKGSPAEPIRFTGVVSSSGFWDGILVTSPDLRNELDYCVVEYAGGGELLSVLPNTAIGVANYAGHIGKLNLSNTLVQHTAGNGLSVTKIAEILSFSDNLFHHNAGAALQIPPSSVSKLDNLSDYGTTNNFNGVEILKDNLKAINEQIWNPLPGGAKYRLLGNMEIESGLRINPGFILESAADLYIKIDNTGYLVAEGTADNNIVFEGQVKQAGAWRGIESVSTDVRNKLSYCVVAHGGSAPLQSGLDKANIGVIKYAGFAGTLTVTNCLIKDGSGCGISKGLGGILTESGNTFLNLVGNSVCN